MSSSEQDEIEFVVESDSLYELSSSESNQSIEEKESDEELEDTDNTANESQRLEYQRKYMARYRARKRKLREQKKQRIAELEARVEELSEDELEELSETKQELEEYYEKERAKRTTEEARRKNVEKANRYRLKHPEKVREFTRKYMVKYRARKKAIREEKKSRVKELEDRLEDLNENEFNELDVLKAELIKLERKNRVRHYTPEQKRKNSERANLYRLKNPEKVSEHTRKYMVQYRARQKVIKDQTKTRIMELEDRLEDLNEKEVNELETLRTDLVKLERRDRKDRVRTYTPEQKRRNAERSNLYRLKNPEKVNEIRRKYMVQYRARQKVIREEKKTRIAELEDRLEDLSENEFNELEELKTELIRLERRDRIRNYTPKACARVCNSTSTPESRRKRNERAKIIRQEKGEHIREQQRLHQRDYRARKRVLREEEKRKRKEFEQQRIAQLDDSELVEWERKKKCSERMNRYREKHSELIRERSRKAAKEKREKMRLFREELKDMEKEQKEYLEIVELGYKDFVYDEFESNSEIEDVEISEELLDNMRQHLIYTKIENVCALKQLIKEIKGAGEVIINNDLYKVKKLSKKSNAEEYKYEYVEVSQSLLKNIRLSLSDSEQKNLCALKYLIEELENNENEEFLDSDSEDLIVEEIEEDSNEDIKIKTEVLDPFMTDLDFHEDLTQVNVKEENDQATTHDSFQEVKFERRGSAVKEEIIEEEEMYDENMDNTTGFDFEDFQNDIHPDAEFDLKKSVVGKKILWFE